MWIRDYDVERDGPGLRDCFIALQDHERDFAPEVPSGLELVDDYVPFMLERVAALSGRLFVAVEGEQILGFATALVRPREEPDDVDAFSVEVAELSVLPAWRGRGIGARLMEVCERFARELGAPSLRVRVDARNPDAQRFYRRAGFEDAVVLLAKSLQGAH